MSRRKPALDARWWIVLGTVVSVAALAYYLLDPEAGTERRARMAAHLKPHRAAA